MTFQRSPPAKQAHNLTRHGKPFGRGSRMMMMSLLAVVTKQNSAPVWGLGLECRGLVAIIMGNGVSATTNDLWIIVYMNIPVRHV